MEASGAVEIKETGIANGNMKTDSLIINKGGIFSGNVTRMSEEEDKAKKKGKASKIKKDDDAANEDDFAYSAESGDSGEISEYENSNQENEEGLSL